MHASRSSLLQCAVVPALLILATGDAAAVVPDVKSFCIRYAGHATSESIVAENLRCAANGAPTWSTDNNVHLSWCLSQFGSRPSPQQEAEAEKAADILEKTRLALLKTCQANPPAQTGGGGDLGKFGDIINVVGEVTMYDTFADGNQDICYLHGGDTVKILNSDAGMEPPWMHVRGVTGECPGKAGYVYNQGELSK